MWNIQVWFSEQKSKQAITQRKHFKECYHSLFFKTQMNGPTELELGILVFDQWLRCIYCLILMFKVFFMYSLNLLIDKNFDLN